MKNFFEFKPIYFEIDAKELCTFNDIKYLNNLLYDLNVRKAKGLIVFKEKCINCDEVENVTFITFYCDTIDSLFNVLTYLKQRLHFNTTTPIEAIFKLYVISKEVYLIHKQNHYKI